MLNRETHEGFFVSTESDSMRIMALQGPWKSAYESEISKLHIDGIRLSASLGWRFQDLSFLASMPQLRSIEIYSWETKDISAIETLRSLEHIAIECEYKAEVDFSAFPRLKRCHLKWRPKAKSVLRAKGLTELNIVDYPFEDLTALSALSCLTKLKLSSTKLSSLSGASTLSELSYLDLYRCTNLTSLAGVEQCHRIQQVALELCKKLGSVEPLGELSSLKLLSMNECGNIETLSPLSKCQALEELFFIGSTVISDADVGLFQKLPSLRKMWFANRKGYSHSREMIQSILEGRPLISG